jgi:hypothetical protein
MISSTKAYADLQALLRTREVGTGITIYFGRGDSIGGRIAEAYKDSTFLVIAMHNTKTYIVVESIVAVEHFV